ncbi:Hcp family type VI secretion system effector [Paraburkholderia ferrariae]|jgi:type VI secretion system secreted protein Hcp|uniref:Hcp family type VI secretion system effector n=1 Tax=Paraburkholderia ferrariae TaxID=386056 RepID=UPI0004893D33|nr:type VI secretion system tube protein Hcp [Paraburkholderia ferrariae]
MADIFIKIDGISGESRDAAHPDEVEVLHWGWHIAQQSGMHSGSGGGAAKASVSDLHFTHAIDRASPNLASYCFQGKPVPRVVLTMRKAGGVPLEYLRYTLSEVMVTRVEPAAGAGLVLEHVALSFARMKQEYVVQGATGGSQGTVTALIDVKQNSAASNRLFG